MNDLTHKLEKYAQLIIQSGCNLQPGQELLLTASTDTCEFTRIVTAEAYKQGASKVTVVFSDEVVSRLHFEHCALDIFEHYPEWQALLTNSMAENRAAVLNITSEDPLAMLGIDQDKLVAHSRAGYEACKPFQDAIAEGKITWCIVGAAAPKWAGFVFPDIPVEEAVDKLWQAIFSTVRVDTEDPLAAWA